MSVSNDVLLKFVLSYERQKLRKYWRYRQKNSGGYFQKPAINVYIEADSYIEANKIAENNGIYFNGCKNFIDCSCCGDRWYEQNKYDQFYLDVINKKLFTESDAEFLEREQIPKYLIIEKEK